MKLRLVLYNIRSTYNVGAILRTAEGVGVDQVVLSGYTPCYNDPRILPHLREKLDRQIEKSALGAEKMVPQESVEDLLVWLEQSRVEGWTIIGLENNLDADEETRKVLLGAWDIDRKRREILPRQEAKERMVLILGEEVHGIPADVRKKCDFFLEIPMVGRKESFNVSVAAGMALWELLKEDLHDLR